MYPKKNQQETVRDSVLFLKNNKEYIATICLAQKMDFVDLQTHHLIQISLAKKADVDKSIKLVDKILKSAVYEDKIYPKIRRYLEKLLHFSSHGNLDNFEVDDHLPTKPSEL